MGEQGEMQLSDLCTCVCVCVRLSLPYAGNSQRNLKLHVLRTAFIGVRTREQQKEREGE